MAPELEPEITLPWLVKLRWAFLVGQLVVLPVAHVGFGVAVGWWALGVSSVVLAASNLLVPYAPARWSRARVIGGTLALDIALMTLVFAASGGAMNPFTVFYLVHLTLSAVVLDTAWTIGLAALSIAGFGLLFALPAPPHHHVPGMDMGAIGMSHLEGMWIAFALAAALTAFFVTRIARAIALQRDEIATLRETAARNARLAALTTLAAGAAHELNNPLATIAVAAHEARRHATGSVGEDLDLISSEVDRCQHILHQLAARAEQGDAPAPTTIAALGDKIRDHLGAPRAARVALDVAGADAEVTVPSEQLAQSVVALIKNAIDASPPDATVTVRLARADRELTFAVEDRGAGIAPDVLARIGEPFFTTKQPGRGLGLGVFLARAFFESRGGEVVIESELGRGTTATARLPAGGPA